MLRTLFAYQRKIERPMGTSPDMTPRQEAILVALRDYHVLAAPHVKKLLFGQNALSSAQTLLADLEAKGYAQRRFISSETENPREASGKAFYVYGLDAKGHRHLLEEGRDVSARFRPSDFRKLTNGTLRHTLEINAFLINLQLLARTRPELRVAQVTHEHELHRTPVQVTLPSGKTARVVADAWIDLRIKGPDGVYQMSWWSEIDRQTRERHSFQQKIERLLCLLPQPYEAAFDAPADALTIAFVASGGDNHAKRLCTWIEQELTRQQRADLANVFSITPTMGIDDDPEELFLSPRTIRPFQPRPSVLIDLEGSGDG